MRLVLLAIVASSAIARAQDSYPLGGSLGLTVASGGEYVLSAGQNIALNGFLAPIEVGGSWGISEKNQLRIAGRLSVPGPMLYASVYAGIRNSRGERVKTFFDLDLAVHITPILTAGVRLAFGVQYELLPVIGIYALTGVQAGGGAGLRLSFELLLGLQFRTYLLGG